MAKRTRTPVEVFTLTLRDMGASTHPVQTMDGLVYAHENPSNLAAHALYVRWRKTFESQHAANQAENALGFLPSEPAMLLAIQKQLLAGELDTPLAPGGTK